MTLYMFRQIVRPGERFPANIASVRLHARMRAARVPGEVARLAEAFSAFPARERLLARVGSRMRGQVAGMREKFPARIAFIGPVSYVRSNVLHQVVRAREPATANATHERFLSQVLDSNVSVQFGARREAGRARRALERFAAHVHRHVTLKTAPIGQNFPAMFARESNRENVIVKYSGR